MNLNFVNRVTVSIALVFEPRYSLAVLLVNRDYSVVVILTFKFNMVNCIRFQETAACQTMNHLILSFCVFKASLMNGSKRQHIDPTF